MEYDPEEQRSIAAGLLDAIGRACRGGRDFDARSYFIEYRDFVREHFPHDNRMSDVIRRCEKKLGIGESLYTR
ncbi:MAG: hypothetical protein HYX24_00645 [Candidatus Aenigmarchaeota archaeon]|nr:hypothetical protein [Candidatus Aenigmarchaeota archaeon]